MNTDDRESKCVRFAESLPRPQAGEQMDVGAPTVRVMYHQSNQFPHFKRVDPQAQVQFQRAKK